MRLCYNTIIQLYVILISCNMLWGGNPEVSMELGEVYGPNSIREGATAEFSISPLRDVNVTYEWTCYPLDAGCFYPLDGPKTIFSAANVKKDTPVEIWALITMERIGTVLKKRNITVTDSPGWVFSWENVEGTRIAVSSNGDIFFAGQFRSTVDFDPTQAVDEHIGAGELWDIFLSKFSGEGEYQWTKTWGGAGWDGEVAIALDSSNNIYITGLVSNNVDLDPGPRSEIHTCSGIWDMFLSKFNSQGEYQWGLTWGSPSILLDGERVNDLAVDSYGNVLIVGNFKGRIDFDPGPKTDEHIANGGTDVFLCEYDLNGKFNWVTTWGGQEDDYGTCVAVDARNDIYVGFNYQENAFLRKCCMDGETLWVRSWGSPGQASVSDIAVDSGSRVYISGTYEGEADFDPGPGISPGSWSGKADIFLSRFDANGDLVWVRAWGGNAYDWVSGMATDDIGNIYLGGYFENIVDFDPGSITNEKISNGDQDAFILAINISGDYIWSQTWGGNSDDCIITLSTDYIGNIYASGCFSGSVDFQIGSCHHIRQALQYQSDFLIKLPADSVL